MTYEKSASGLKCVTEHELRAAIHHGEIWPSFQPLVELNSEAIVGFEILARWTLPDNQLIPPSVFIPLAEDCGLIDLLTEKLVLEACTKARDWPGNFILAINLSAGQFRDIALGEKIQKIVGSTGFPLERVHIEITEGALLENDHTVQSNILALKRLGMGIALDDFGTGYASLTQLHAFPFDKLKIDMSFVRNITSDSGSRKIVASVIALGQSLGMTVVAEGVETQEQATLLRRLGCDVGQGWLFGSAVSAGEASDLVAQHRQTPLIRHQSTAPSFQRVHELETLYNSAPVGFCLLNTELVHMSVNARFADMFDLSPEEMIGRDLFSIMNASEATCVTADLQRVLAGETIVKQTYRPSGSDRSFFIVNQRVDDDDGRAIGISVTSIDVTVFKEVETLLLQTEDHARWTIGLSPNIAWAADREGAVYFVGPSPDETMLTTSDRVSDWMSRIHPVDHERVRRAWLDWIPCKKPFEVVFRMRLGDADYSWMVSRAKPHFDGNGQVDRWYGVITEIATQDQLRQKVRLMES